MKNVFGSIGSHLGFLGMVAVRRNALVAVLLAYFCSLTATSTSLASEPPLPEDSPAAEQLSSSDAFRLFSGSCAELAYLSESQKKQLADPRADENLTQFCFPEEPFECPDYNQLVASFGSLKANEGGFQCSLVLH